MTSPIIKSCFATLEGSNPSNLFKKSPTPFWNFKAGLYARPLTFFLSAVQFRPIFSVDANLGKLEIPKNAFLTAGVL